MYLPLNNTKTLINHFVAGVVTLVCILGATLVTHAAWDDSETGTDSVNSGKVTLYAEKGSFKVPCDYEVVPLTDSSNYSCYQVTYGDIYLNYSVKISGATTGEYFKGVVIADDTLSVSGMSGGSYTVNNTSYEVGLVYSSPDINVSFRPLGSGSYMIVINFDNLYCHASDEFGFTIVLKCYARMYQINNGSVSLPVTGNVVVGHSLGISSFTQIVEQEYVSDYDAYLNALEDSLNVIGIKSDTGIIRTSLNSVDSKLASFMAQEASNDAAINSQLYNLLSGDIGNSNITSAGQILGLIYQKLNSTQQSLSQADTEVATYNTQENTIHNSVDGIVNGIAFSPQTHGNTTYTTGLATIRSVNADNFVNDHAIAFEFWRDVGNKALTRDTVTGWGAVAGFFMIVIILAFTCWVLHL